MQTSKRALLISFVADGGTVVPTTVMSSVTVERCASGPGWTCFVSCAWEWAEGGIQAGGGSVAPVPPDQLMNLGVFPCSDKHA